MAGYLKIGDIKGECQDKGHKDWIKLLSFSQGLSRPMRAGTSGSTRHRSSVDVGDLVCTKEMDASSTKIMEAVCDGTVFPEVKIHLATSTGADGRANFYEVTMTQVHVTSYDVSGSARDGDIPIETFAFNFEEIKWDYNKFAADGSPQGKVSAGWKVEEGVKA